MKEIIIDGIKYVPKTPESAESNLVDSTIVSTRYVGQYVIVRSRNEGVNTGYVVAADSTGIILKDARRLYYHKPKDKSVSWYEGVALTGLSKDFMIVE